MSPILSFSLAYFYFQLATTNFHSQKDNHVFLTFVISKLGTFSTRKKTRTPRSRRIHFHGSCGPALEMAHFTDIELTSTAHGSLVIGADGFFPKSKCQIMEIYTVN